MGERIQDHISHYREDGETFDYFHVENPVIREEERRRIQVLTHTMNFKAGQRILDAGSGGGWVAQAYLKGEVYVCSVDLSARSLKGIRERFDPRKAGGYVVADLYHLPFKPGVFDGATSNDVFEHLEYLDRGAAEIRSVLKDGARMFVSVPYRENIIYYLCVHCNKKTPINAHLHSFDDSEIAELFLENGFAIEAVRKFINKGLSIFQIYYYLCRWMPYRLWRLLDMAANSIVRKPSRIGLKLLATERSR
jgi:cyclopropane fatty-acyl-phospholipid synthase-like methyltransferase